MAADRPSAAVPLTQKKGFDSACPGSRCGEPRSQRSPRSSRWAAIAPVAAQAKLSKVTGGQTTITPSSASQQFLTANGISVTPVAPASAGSGGGLVLPISGGRVNGTTLRGFILHRGGLKFSKGLRFRDGEPLRHHEQPPRGVPVRHRPARRVRARARPSRSALRRPPPRAQARHADEREQEPPAAAATPSSPRRSS